MEDLATLISPSMRLGGRKACLGTGLRLWSLLGGLACSWAAQGLPAQTNAYGRSVVRLVLVDSATGRPLARTALRNVGQVWWGAESDTPDGVLAWDTASAPRVRAECAARGGEPDWPKLADLDAARLPASAPDAVIRLTVNGGPCDRRDLLEADSTWTGYYLAGFEMNDFRICGDSERRSIWVEWKADPPARLRRPGATRLLLRARGRLVGPWTPGHWGAAEYRLTIDSVIFARPVRGEPADCAAKTPATSPAPLR